MKKCLILFIIILLLLPAYSYAKIIDPNEPMPGYSDSEGNQLYTFYFKIPKGGEASFKVEEDTYVLKVKDIILSTISSGREGEVLPSYYFELLKNGESMPIASYGDGVEKDYFQIDLGEAITFQQNYPEGPLYISTNIEPSLAERENFVKLAVMFTCKDVPKPNDQCNCITFSGESSELLNTRFGGYWKCIDGLVEVEKAGVEEENKYNKNLMLTYVTTFGEQREGYTKSAYMSKLFLSTFPNPDSYSDYLKGLGYTEIFDKYIIFDTPPVGDKIRITVNNLYLDSAGFLTLGEGKSEFLNVGDSKVINGLKIYLDKINQAFEGRYDISLIVSFVDSSQLTICSSTSECDNCLNLNERESCDCDAECTSNLCESGRCKAWAVGLQTKKPEVTVKRMIPGVIGKNDGEIIFDVVNEDVEHSMEGYLTCSIPNDVIVTSTTGVSTGDGLQYATDLFRLDSSQFTKSISLGLSSSIEGEKLIKCKVKYAFLKEVESSETEIKTPLYLSPSGEYTKVMSNDVFKELTLERNIAFQTEAKEEQIDKINPIFYILTGVGAVIIILLAYLIFVLSRKK